MLMHLLLEMMGSLTSLRTGEICPNSDSLPHPVTVPTWPTSLLSLSGRHMGMMFGWGHDLKEERDGSHLIFDWSVVHLQQGNVVFVCYLVEAAMSDDLLDPSIHMVVRFVCVQHMILPNPHKKVAWSNVL